MSNKKFPIYRFVRCDGYLKPNNDKWKIDCFDSKFNVVDESNLTGLETLVAHKGKVIGTTDLQRFTRFFSSSYSRPEFEEEIYLDWGETIHQEMYHYVDSPFEGFLVEVRQLCVEKDIGAEFADSVDTGVGTIPERYYIGKWNEKYVKVGKVYINRNGQYKLVPIENIHDLEVV